MSPRNLPEQPPCTLHIAHSCPTPASTGQHRPHAPLRKRRTFFFFNFYFLSELILPRLVRRRRISGCCFNISCTKSAVCHPGTCRVTLFPIKMVLNECLMTEHGVSPASETANEAGRLRQTHLPACRRARPGRGGALPPGSPQMCRSPRWLRKVSF